MSRQINTKSNLPCFDFLHSRGWYVEYNGSPTTWGKFFFYNDSFKTHGYSMRAIVDREQALKIDKIVPCLEKACQIIINKYYTN